VLILAETCRGRFKDIMKGLSHQFEMG
jgi:hypothetical protein